jgi:VCBS repeat-containing protein
MRYQIASKWSLTEHFVIDDAAGTPAFDVRGNLGFSQHLTMRDQSGQEVAHIKKHLMSTKHDIEIGGQKIAEIHHEGFFGDRYEINSAYGQISAKGHFGGWNYQIHQQGQTIAQVSREMAWREKFIVDIDDNISQAFILAVVLAIDAIHHEREQEQDRGGFGGGGGGLFGGNFP